MDNQHSTATTGLPSPPESSTNETPMKSGSELRTGSKISGEPSLDQKAVDQPNAKREATGEYLEDLSHKILDVNLNLKDNFHPLIVKHMSPAFRGKHDALPKVNNRDDHQDNLKKHLDKQPDFHVNILNHSSEVDDSRGRATVYLWYEITGLEHGLEREAVAVLSWERRQGTWMIIKHSGMRGPSGFA